MHDEHVSIWDAEETHQADACVDGIAEQLDSFGELLTRDLRVSYAERDPRGVGRERHVLGPGGHTVSVTFTASNSSGSARLLGRPGTSP